MRGANDRYLNRLDRPDDLGRFDSNQSGVGLSLIDHVLSVGSLMLLISLYAQESGIR